MYLTARFDRPRFSRSQVIMLTNKHKHTDKQTDAAENIDLASLRYTPVGNDIITLWLIALTVVDVYK